MDSENRSELSKYLDELLAAEKQRGAVEDPKYNILLNVKDSLLQLMKSQEGGGDDGGKLELLKDLKIRLDEFDDLITLERMSANILDLEGDVVAGLVTVLDLIQSWVNLVQRYNQVVHDSSVGGDLLAAVFPESSVGNDADTGFGPLRDVIRPFLRKYTGEPDVPDLPGFGPDDDPDEIPF